MSKIKISLEDFMAYDFELIAIHSVLEETKLAFLLNRNLGLKLMKNEKSIQSQTKSGQAFFNWYVFDDEESDIFWNLVVNKKIETIQNSNGLFSEDSIAFTLVPEIKNADYILKIDHVDSYFDVESIVEEINNFTKVSTAYIVDLENIKSIKNLIF